MVFEKSTFATTSVILMTMLFFSCAKFSAQLAQAKTKNIASHSFKAGVFAFDITPPPGQPMGGFGNDIAQVARGHWTRLFAKSYYMEDASGNFVIIVTSDLWSFPAGLADYILEILQSDPNPIFHIARENVLFTASHTHHSPGNYSSSFGYNLGSSALAGFDQDLFKFLAHRIAYCIKQSMLNQEEANLSYNQISLPGLTRNRSIDPFLNNPQEDITYFQDRIPNAEIFLDSTIQCLTKRKEVFQAINPMLTSIVIQQKNSQKIMGIINHFAVHPTVAGPKNPFYSGDIFRIAENIIENDPDLFANAHNQKIITSYLNGAEGDVSANWSKQNFSETHRIGTTLGEAILNSIKDVEGINDPIINIQLQFRDIRNQQVVDLRNELDCDDLQIARTSEIPVVGKSVLKGTEDGRVLSMDENDDECLFQEGLTDPTCKITQGRKKEHGISKLAASSAPKILPVGLIKIGPLRIATLPGEVSSSLGGRIERSLGNSTSSPVLVTSLANEYISYFVSPAEYELQHYEGGFTVYGKATGPYFEQELIKLDGKGQHFSEYYGNKEYDVGPLGLDKDKLKSDFNLPWDLSDMTDAMAGSQPNLFSEYIEIAWDFVPTFLDDYPDGYLSNPIPSVYVEKKNIDGNWQTYTLAYEFEGKEYFLKQNDKQSSNFISAFETDVRGALIWKTIWFHAGTVQPEDDFRVCSTWKGSTYCKEIMPN